MSRASISSKRSRRRSKDSSRDGVHLDKQPPPEMDTIRSVDDKEKNCKPLVDKSSSAISNSEPPQPSEPHVQKDTVDDSPKGALTAKAEKIVEQEVQPTPSEIVDVMRQVLDVLKDSTIASKTGKDNRSRFWAAHKRVAGEHDDEFLERYYNDMDIVLVFSGLFSAVSSAFIVAMESNLSPDPNITTHALLTQLVLIGLGNFTAAGSTPVAPASTWSPSIASIRTQSVAYASLSFSLLAAFGAVLGKQWLGYYKSHRYGRGSEEERAKRRQERFDGIVTWYFDAVVQSFPILLQFSLFLFGIALSANMWYEQHTIAWVIIATTVFGFLFYSLTVMAALVSPACPFQTPVSTILRMLRVDKVLRPMVKSTSRYLQQLVMPVHVLQLVLNSLFYYLTYVIYWISKLSDSAFMAYSFVWRCLQLLFSASQHLLHWRRSSTRDVDPEAQGPDQNLDIVTTNQDPLKLKLPDTPTSDLEAPSIMWLIETSTDPEVFYAAASLVPDVDWPLDLDVSDTLHQLYDVYTTCLDIQKQIIPSLEEKASACTKALCHLYCHRIFQGRPAYRLSDKGSIDYYVFKQMLGRTKVDDNVLVATTMLFVAKYKQPYWWLSSPKFGAHPDSVPLLKWLSRTLPFHYVTGKVNEDVQELAMTVISKLLCSSSSLSPQIIANCTLLACVMVGVQFDKKDIVRVDKSPALRQLIESLWTQLLKVCSLDGRDLDEDITGDVRRAWNLLDIFCHILALGLPYPVLPKPMWILGVCGKIYSRARSFQHTDQDSSAALRRARRFRLASDTNQSMFVDPADPAWLWEHQISWRCNSHSSEDFDWLVDYLGDVCSSDHKTAGDILVLLSSMRVGCSPAKQHLFIEALIACMSSSMPPRLRHAALRAAHSSQEVLASIDIVGHADMVLTNLSLAILTAVCPQPGATATDYGPDRSFYYERDLCYLELIFALARNSCWRPHLHCQTDRAIRILALRHGARSRHTFYLVSFFLRMSSEEASATSLSSITEQQWWDMMSQAWYFAEFVLNNTQCVEFLPVLVERTKKYMHVAPQDDLWQLIKDVDGLIERPELKQREGVTDAVKVLRSIANDMLAK